MLISFKFEIMYWLEIYLLLTKNNKLFLNTNCLEFNPLMPDEFKLFDYD